MDIELAIMREFNFRQNLIVPNITSQMGLLPFETDVLVLTASSYAYGFEIKTSKSDLMADFKKPRHAEFNQCSRNGKVGLDRFYSKFKYFYFAVPEQLKNAALEVIPEFCGLWVLRKDESGRQKFYQAKPPTKLFDKKWSEGERYEVARLGTMRIYTLKRGLVK